MRILLIDDNDDDRDLLAKVLRKHNYDVLTASGGGVALQLLENNVVDRIIVDLRMPTMSGPEFVRLLRADPRWKTVPVIGRTALEADEIPEGQLPLGMTIIQKLDSLPELLGALAAKYTEHEDVT